MAIDSPSIAPQIASVDESAHPIAERVLHSVRRNTLGPPGADLSYLFLLPAEVLARALQTLIGISSDKIAALYEGWVLFPPPTGDKKRRLKE